MTRCLLPILSAYLLACGELCASRRVWTGAADSVWSAGLTTVAPGTLKVCGTSLAGPLLVKGGATFRGSTGNVAVTVESGALLDSGCSPGTLTAGSLSLGAGTKLLIEIGGTARGVSATSRMARDGAVNPRLLAFLLS